MDSINFQITSNQNLEIEDQKIIKFDRENIFTLIVKKNIESPKTFQPEEIITELIFKYYSIKYKKIEYYDSQVGLYFGKLPILLSKKNIISSRSIIKFLAELIVKKDSTFWDRFDQYIYIFMEVFSLALEYLIHLKERKKNLNTKNIFKKIYYYFSDYSYYENNIKSVFDNFSFINDSNNYYMSTEDKAKQLILHSYDMLMKIYFQEMKDAWKFEDKKERKIIFNIIAYAFIKEEMDNPSLANLLGYEHVTKFKNEVINFIEGELFSTIINKPITFEISEKNLMKFTEKNSKKFFKIEKEKFDLIENKASELQWIRIKQILFIALIIGGWNAYYHYNPKKIPTAKDQYGEEKIKSYNENREKNSKKN